MHELDTGDTRADDRHALGKHLGRIAVAGHKNALAVGMAPLGNAWPAASGDQHGVGFQHAHRDRLRRRPDVVTSISLGERNLAEPCMSSTP